MSFPMKPSLRKYFIMGSQNCDRNPGDILEAAAKGGITAFQFREKGPSSLNGNAKLELGKELRAICRSYHIPFIVNDDVELVELLDADGIHVGQDDRSAEELRQAFPNKIIGLSVSTTDEVDRSPIDLVDYIGAGPIFSTTTKTDAKAAVGLEWIQTLRAQFPTLPIVGIGGIDTMNAKSVLEAGADGVSFISVITQAEDIAKAVKAI
ncbi:thiamine phosphate synthase [Oceanobacillus profundus]|uniref:thiamine phosphate synthase n=1 Tax=Oceanobacillus profundus TaxID=372463 RepID=UPI002040BBC6|nr:thiamine phosphate synthase [Oceanobacillus profundus]MCM3398920.1 thiamine phosphate synthase [Oceanobacillus profundus]